MTLSGIKVDKQVFFCITDEGGNKLERLSPASFSSLTYCFQVRPNHTSFLPRYAPVLRVKVIIGWKGLPGTNKLAYFYPSSVMHKNSFFNVGTWK
jgi:hypothetical protein